LTLDRELVAALEKDYRTAPITLVASWFNSINRVADALGVGRE
jgi:hypothetical protein